MFNRFRFNWDHQIWYQSAIRFDAGLWLFARRKGDYNPVPLIYLEQETLGM